MELISLNYSFPIFDWGNILFLSNKNLEKKNKIILKEEIQKLDNAFAQAILFLENHKLLSEDFKKDYKSILQDSFFVKLIKQSIKKGQISWKEALIIEIKNLEKQFNLKENKHIKNKINDYWEIKNLLFTINQNIKIENGVKFILLKHFSFIYLLTLNLKNIELIFLKNKIEYSHIEILLRELNIPIIYLNSFQISKIKDLDFLFVNLFEKKIIVNPKNISFEKNNENNKLIKTFLSKDNKEIFFSLNSNPLSNNLWLKNEFKSFYSIALIRSENLFYDFENFPSFLEQREKYTKLLTINKNLSINIRLFDYKDDKSFAYFKNKNKKNLRGTSFLLKNKILLQEQLSALITSNEFSNLSITIPYFKTEEELNEILNTIHFVKNEFKNKTNKLSFFKIGVMIETLSSIDLIHLLENKVDFILIGSNDLLEEINYKYDEVITFESDKFKEKLIEIFKICNQIKMKVNVCGNLTRDIKYYSFLYNKGINNFIVDYSTFFEISQNISLISLVENYEK